MSTSVTETQTLTVPITAETILSLFPDIDTRGDALEGHDEEQIRLMDEVCIVTDENDMPIGTASKKLCMSLECIVCTRPCGPIRVTSAPLLTDLPLWDRPPDDQHQQGALTPSLLCFPFQ